MRKTLSCLKCNGKLEEVHDCHFIAEVRDEEVPIVVPGLRCDSCKWETVHLGEQMTSFMRTAAETYRRKHNLLSAKEIKRRRGALGMSQADFAEWLGVGITSVKRWETGFVQDRAMDELIRLKTEPKELRATLKKLERFRKAS